MPQPTRRTAQTILAWPTIPRPSSPLTLTPIASGIKVIDQFLSPSTLSSFLSFLSTPNPLISWTCPTPPKRGEATRLNYRFAIKDPTFAKELWESSGLNLVCQQEQGGLEGNRGRKAVGLNGNIRCYRYEKGSYFGRKYSLFSLSLSLVEVEGTDV